MNAIVPRTQTVTEVGNPLLPRNMGEAMQLADSMARCKIGIPEHLRNSPGDCLMVVEVATRWRMSPFAVAQCTNKVKDKLGYEGKIVHAAIESCGVIDGYVDYEFSGTGPSRSIRVFATRRNETAPRDVTVKLADAQTDNPHWKKSPDQMLVYHGARVWARRWTPGVLLGVYAPEEFDQPRDDFRGTTITNEHTPEPAAAPQSQPQTVQAPTMLQKVARRLDACTKLALVQAVEDLPSVQTALTDAPDHIVRQIHAMLAAARHRIEAAAPAPEAPTPSEDLDAPMPD